MYKDGFQFIKDTTPPASDFCLKPDIGEPPEPEAEPADPAVPQERQTFPQELFQQNLLTITGQLGPLSPAQFMTLSGNACKLYAYISSAVIATTSFHRQRQTKLIFPTELMALESKIASCGILSSPQSFGCPAEWGRLDRMPAS